MPRALRSEIARNAPRASANGYTSTGGSPSAPVRDSSVTGNSATYGGGIDNDNEGTLTISGSTLSGNSAQLGGGIYNLGNLTVRDSTILGNVAPLGADVYNVGQLFLYDSVIGVLYP